MSDADVDSSVRLSWIVIFLLLTLGIGAATVLAVGGSLVAGAIVPPVLG